jgi:hypothetical protein
MKAHRCPWTASVVARGTFPEFPNGAAYFQRHYPRSLPLRQLNPAPAPSEEVSAPEPMGLMPGELLRVRPQEATPCSSFGLEQGVNCSHDAVPLGQLWMDAGGRASLVSYGLGFVNGIEFSGATAERRTSSGTPEGSSRYWST